MARSNIFGNGRRRIVIVGATSGIGRELALLYLAKEEDHVVGITGRRTEKLEEIRDLYPGRTHIRTMDVHREDSVQILDSLIEEMGGIDLIIYSAGVGTQNPQLDPAVEMETVNTNAVGFSRIVIHAYDYFSRCGQGQIVAISSLAGIRSLRQSPSYSATKRYQIHYMSCLAQKAHKDKVPITFTTIVPGFIRTDMLRHRYPFVSSIEKGTLGIYRAIEMKMRYTTVPGRWRWLEIVWRLIPNFIWERVW